MENFCEICWHRKTRSKAKVRVSCHGEENGMEESKRKDACMIDVSVEITELRKKEQNSKSIIIKELDCRDEMD